MSKKNLTLNKHKGGGTATAVAWQYANTDNVHMFFMFQFTPAAFFKNTKTIKKNNYVTRTTKI